MSNLTLDLQLALEDDTIPEQELLRSWAETAWLGDTDTEVTLRVVDEAESTELNRTYRGKDAPTNVLSFPFEAPPDIPIALLGDLVICAEVLAREAREQGKELTAHWAHMVIHGMLHLQGYDHQSADEAQAMESMEIQLLSRLGYPDPYRPFDAEDTDRH